MARLRKRIYKLKTLLIDRTIFFERCRIDLLLSRMCKKRIKSWWNKFDYANQRFAV